MLEITIFMILIQSLLILVLFKRTVDLQLEVAEILEEQIEESRKENLTMAKLTQAHIDELTRRIENGNKSVADEIQREAEEIKAAIASNDVDTTALEAAVANSEKLQSAVANIFTPESEAPVEDEEEDLEDEDFEDEDEFEDEDLEDEEEEVEPEPVR